jgi:hypothetical protein
MRTITLPAVAAAILLPLGCSEREGDLLETPDSPPGHGSGSDSDDGIPDDSDEPQKWDTGDGEGGGPGDEEGGCAKIDFLFVVDNSGSMADEQQNLINSFQGFIDTIMTATGARDFQIMVVDSDAYVPEGGNMGWACDTAMDPACCTDFCAEYPYGFCNEDRCNPIPPPSSCDDTLGAGKVLDQNGQPCNIDGGSRYMLASQPDLGEVFACVAEVGTLGDGDEHPMEATVTALSNALNAGGACNEAFVRDDAILVVTIITDEEDDHEGDDVACAIPADGSPGEPPAWFDAVVDAKLGVEKSAVVLALVGPVPPDTPCSELDKCAGGIHGAEQAPRIVDFTHRFTYNLVCPVCAQSYNECFEEAVYLVDTACEEFKPQG